MHSSIPKFIRAKEKGLLQKKISQAEALLASCTLCPRQCRVDRTKEEKGYCKTGKKALVASFAPHFGEEPQLVGQKGSGTIFFSHCSLKCVFCQNHEISIEGQGRKIDDEEMASIMLYLQKTGCLNINLVTPSHVVPQILKAVNIAADNGLKIPLVYNCSGYESIEALEILKDMIDIYMPDFKFWDPGSAKKYCHAEDYPAIAKKAVVEMHSQAGDLVMDDDGLAVSGLLVRHLVMPGGLFETKEILTFLKEQVSPFTHVNIMSQYHPAGEALKIKALSQPLSPLEFKKAFQMGKDSGLTLIR